MLNCATSRYSSEQKIFVAATSFTVIQISRQLSFLNAL